MEPVKIKFEKKVGAVGIYPVMELDENYNEIGVRHLKPGDECLVSHYAANDMTTTLPDAFSAKDKINKKIVASEKAALENKAAAERLDHMKSSSRLEDKFGVLVKRVEALEESTGTSPGLKEVVDSLGEQIGEISDSFDELKERLNALESKIAPKTSPTGPINPTASAETEKSKAK